jgi:hypothetical protein
MHAFKLIINVIEVMDSIHSKRLAIVNEMGKLLLVVLVDEALHYFHVVLGVGNELCSTQVMLLQQALE